MKTLSNADHRRLSRWMARAKRETAAELEPRHSGNTAAESMGDRDGVDDVERAELERQRDVSQAESAIDRARLADIERAETLLAAGSYGRCINCLHPIPRARLLAKPEALRCVECQTSYESSLRR